MKKKIFKAWRTILPFVYMIVLIHFLKDITQDILRISTPLDLLGDVKEDLSSFPALIQKLFVLLGVGSFMAEAFLLVINPHHNKEERVYASGEDNRSCYRGSFTFLPNGNSFRSEI